MKYLLLVCFLMSSTLAFGKGGDEVLNGGGIAEGYLHFAMENLGKHIDVCLSQSECAKKNNGREILKLIRDSLKDENAKDILEFSNNAKKPGFFVIEGYVRMAVTGSNVGDTIWYNLDLLYNNGQVRIDYGQAVQSLIHELGHHHGIINHDQLELVGADVRTAITGSVSESTYMPHLGSQGFSAIGTEARSFENSGSLLLLFRDKMVDVTPQFSSILEHCDPDNTSASPLKSKALQFFNLHWQYTSQSQASGEKILTGQVLLYCEHQYLKRYRRFYNFSMGVKVRMGTYFEYMGSSLLAKPEFLFKMVNPVI